MSLLKGRNLTAEITGESHSQEMRLKVKGFPSFYFDKDKLNTFLARRKASDGAYSTPRKEPDEPLFINANNCLIDGDFEVIIKNTNVKSKDYGNLYGKPRPSHADFAWYKKDGVLDFSGGGRFSARLTAPFCVLGGLCKQYLETRGIKIASYLQSIGNVEGASYRDKELSYEEVLSLTKNFPALSKGEQMLKEISDAKSQGDSVGGVIETIVYGMPSGVGDNLFEGLEGKISSLIFSVPAVKGVEFGSGYIMSKSKASQVNDELYYDNDTVKLKTNNNGGINGGISNGFNVTVRAYVKPTPSISKEQNTVDLVSGENVKIKVLGRHDSCVAVRAVPCIESAVAIAIVDEIIGEL